MKYKAFGSLSYFYCSKNILKLVLRTVYIGPFLPKYSSFSYYILLLPFKHNRDIISKSKYPVINYFLASVCRKKTKDLRNISNEDALIYINVQI